MSRYVCKKCGRFVAKDAVTCKCCGCENPAVEQTTTGSTTIDKKEEMSKLVECPHCKFIFNPKERIEDEKFQCPKCSETILNPYYHKSSGYSTSRIVLGLIVILVIVFNIWRACSSADSTEKIQVHNTESEYEYESDFSSDIQNGYQISSGNEEAKAIVFKVRGADNPCFYWVIKSMDGGLQFEYIAADNGSRSVLSSGSCVTMTFGQLKSQAPNTVIRDFSITADKQILMIGPIETHYNADYSERPVYGIIVASKDSSANLFINDTDDENVFVLMDRLEMNVK